MRVLLILLALFSSILGTAAGAAETSDEQIQRGPVPDWVRASEPLALPADPRGMVFVRRQDSLVHLDDKGQAIYSGYRMKILHSKALQLGNLSVVWNPEAGNPIFHSIKIYRGDEVIDVLKDAKFKILQREDQLDVAMLDGRLTAVLTISDLRVGDELEVEYTNFASDRTLGSDVSGLLVLAPNAAPGRFHLGLNWIAGQEPLLKMSKDMAAVAEKGASSVDFRFDNPPALALPKDAPPRYDWQRVVEYSDFPSWPAISKRFATIYSDAAKFQDTSPLKKEVDRIAAAHIDALDRATAALKLVQQDVRYIYVGLDGGNFMPASPETTWQRRYGDCKGKTTLLLALLGRLGIKAEAVLANNSGNDDGLDERLPKPDAFDHVLVRAYIGGKVYYMDGTLPPVARPSLSPVMPYRWILPLTAKGSEPERIKYQPPKTPQKITLYEIDARAGFDQPAKQIQTTIVRGVDGLKQQIELSPLTPEELTNAFRQELVGDTWQAIDDVQWHYDDRAQASVLTISGSGMVDWENEGSGRKSLTLPGGGFNPQGKRIRSSDQDQTAPYFDERGSSCHVTTVRVPTKTRPQQWAFNRSFDLTFFGGTYHRAFELRDGAIRMIRGFRTESEETDAATAQKDNARLDVFDNSMAWIQYSPLGRSIPDNGDVIPATYEIDWTADNVPCMSVEG